MSWRARLVRWFVRRFAGELADYKAVQQAVLERQQYIVYVRLDGKLVAIESDSISGRKQREQYLARASLTEGKSVVIHFFDFDGGSIE